MQFKVPQFLDIEDKIFGPFTFRQFAYLAGGAGICYVLFKLLGLLWGAVPILFFVALSGALTFYRPNNKPFINILESGFKYVSKSKLYIWKKNMEKKAAPPPRAPNDSGQVTRRGARLDSSRLRDLAWSLDVLDLSKKESVDR